MVIHRSKLHVSLKRNFQLMPGVEWLEQLCCYIPDRYEQNVYAIHDRKSAGRLPRDIVQLFVASLITCRSSLEIEHPDLLIGRGVCDSCPLYVG